MTNSKPFLPTMLRLGIAGIGLYYGIQLIDSHETLILLFAYLLSFFCSIAVLMGCFALCTSSLHSAQQIRFDNMSKQRSTVYGSSELATSKHKFLEPFRKRKGLFLGMFMNKALFYDPFASGNAHIITYGPARSGKSCCLVVPTMFSCYHCGIVLADSKKEISEITKKTRIANGRKVIEWNPDKIDEENGVSINLINILIEDINLNNGEKLHDYALLIAKILIKDDVESKDPYFKNGGRRFLVALLLYLAVFRKALCHLPGLRQMVWAPIDKKMQIASVLKCSECYGGILKEYGTHIEELLEPEFIKTFGPMRDYAIDTTQIFASGTKFAKSLIGSEITLNDVLGEDIDFIMSLPKDKQETHGAILGLFYALMFEHLASRDKPTKILFLMEEMGNIGKIPNLPKAITLLPANGARLWFILQSRQQSVSIYGEEIARMMDEQSSVKQGLSIRDDEEKERWSKRSGMTTVKTHSLSHDPNDVNSPWKANISETKRMNLDEDEVGSLGKYEQLISIDNNPVIVADLVKYYQVIPWRDQADPNPYHLEGYPSLDVEPIRLDLSRNTTH